MPDSKDNTEEKPPVNEEITKVLEDLKNAAEKINKVPEEKTESPKPQTNAYADRRAALQKSLGYTDDQMAAHEEMIMRAQAPVIENTGWNRLEKKPDIENFRKDIEKELTLYSQERRTPELMEKIYYMVKGQKAESKPQENTVSKNEKTKTRVTSGPGYSGTDSGVGEGREENEKTEEELDDREKFVADRLGVDYKDYAQSKKVGKNIRELRVPDSRPVNSLADIELKRMVGRR